MRIELLPPNENLRLQDLYSYDILDSVEEKEYNELLEVAAYISNCPMAAISFLDKERQWLKSRRGIAVQEGRREDAFCSHTILGNDVMIVKDATKDERFWHNPYVKGDPSIRFYAGAPIVSNAGYNLGTVCVIDNKPGSLNEEQIKLLSILSRQVSRLLDVHMKNRVIKKRSEECIELEKKLLQKTLKDHEAERNYISTELHENIAQSLAATKFYLELAEGPSQAKDELIRKSKDIINTLVKQVSNLSKSILPTTLNLFDLKEILETLLRQFSKDTGIKTMLNFEGTYELLPEVSLEIYRAVQEQLRNIQRHAKATSVIVTLHAFENICVCIKDNGVGIDLAKFKKGVGINQILSRVEGFNGTLDIFGAPGKGTQLTLTIPHQGPYKKSLHAEPIASSFSI